MKKPIQIFLTPEFHKLFKASCAAEGVTMAEKIKQLMATFINHVENPVKIGMPFDYEVKNPKP